MKNLFYFILCPFLLIAEDYGPIFSWTDDPTSTFNVTWLSSSSKTQAMACSQNDFHLTKFSKTHPYPNTKYFVHRIELKNLKSNQIYKINFSENKFSSGKEFYVKTMPKKEPKNISFVVGGDMMHTRELCQKMNVQAAKLKPDFALLGGDLAYADGKRPKRWFDWLDAWAIGARRSDGLTIPVILAIGNHEVQGHHSKTMKEAPYFYSLFSFPNKEAYYSVDFNDYLSVVVLDSQHTKKISEQNKFLADALEKRKRVPYLFGLYHFPAYGLIKGGLKNPFSQEIRRHWIPIFEKYQPDALFENDHHIYKRSHLMYQGKVNKEKGLLYIGDGSWGVSTRKIPKRKNWPNHVAEAMSRRHLIHVNLANGTKKYTAYSAEGEVLDSFFDKRKLRN